MKKIEVKRQLFHATVGIFIVFLVWSGILAEIGSLYPINIIYFLPQIARPIFIVLILGISLIILSKKHQNPLTDSILSHLERPADRERFPGKGAFFYILGALIISSLFEPEILSAALTVAALGDSSSHIIGEKIGRIKYPLSQEKNIEGIIGGAILGALGAALFIEIPQAFLASFIAMLIEGIEFSGNIEEILDDNLIIPLVASLTIFLFRIVF